VSASQLQPRSGRNSTAATSHCGTYAFRASSGRRKSMFKLPTTLSYTRRRGGGGRSTRIHGTHRGMRQYAHVQAHGPRPRQQEGSGEGPVGTSAPPGRSPRTAHREPDPQQSQSSPSPGTSRFNTGSCTGNRPDQYVHPITHTHTHTRARAHTHTETQHLWTNTHLQRNNPCSRGGTLPADPHHAYRQGEGQCGQLAVKYSTQGHTRCTCGAMRHPDRPQLTRVCKHNSNNNNTQRHESVSQACV
jgi:hypothetical protein